MWLDRTGASFEYALPTGKGSSYFRHREHFQTISRTAQPHTPSDLQARLEGFARLESPLESGAHNRDREHRSELFFQGKASRLPAIQSLTDRTISAALQW